LLSFGAVGSVKEQEGTTRKVLILFLRPEVHRRSTSTPAKVKKKALPSLAFR
jgi:hypothetical protein